MLRHDPFVSVRKVVIVLAEALRGQNDPIDITSRQARVYIALLYGMLLAVLLLIVGLLRTSCRWGLRPS
jgi:hypothetical protein